MGHVWFSKSPDSLWAKGPLGVAMGHVWFSERHQIQVRASMGHYGSCLVQQKVHREVPDSGTGQ